MNNRMPEGEQDAKYWGYYCDWCNKPDNLLRWSNADGDQADLCPSCLETAQREDEFCDRVDAIAGALNILHRLGGEVENDGLMLILRVIARLTSQMEAYRFQSCDGCGKPYSTDDLAWVDEDLLCRDCRGPRNDFPVSMPDTPVEF